MNIEGRLATVLGAGESGLQSALFLKKIGARVLLSESMDGPQFDELKGICSLHGVDTEFGGHSWEKIKMSELIIMSPGIPPSAVIYQKVTKSKIPVWSEIELASRFTNAEIVAVTGTSGKTTVTTLIRDVLSEGGYKVVSCGNIGNSFIREIGQMDHRTIAVVEVSSFQLSHIDQFRPHVGVLLNVSPNHLDWHAGYTDYFDAKWRLFTNQTATDYAVINSSDAECVKKATSLKSKVLYFDSLASENPNFAAVEQVASVYRISPAITQSIFKSFKGLEHRLEVVGNYMGVQYINDSKSTTIASLEWALRRMNQRAILIVGGRYKGGDFSSLRDLISEKVKFIVSIGEASPMIAESFNDIVSVYEARSLEEALRVARGASDPGETVLFSPACSSFDMFKNYRDRGQQFKNILNSWREELVSSNKT